MRLCYALPFLFLGHSVLATEIDFATKLVDLDGNQYKDCIAPKKDAEGKQISPVECGEWNYHTVGLIAFSALARPVPNPGSDTNSLVKQAQRGILATKVYPGKNEKHVVDLSSPEITLIGDEIAKLGIGAVELLKFMEILDPARIKEK